MRNYIILNGTNSNTIPGLLISSLPSISKPLIRTTIEEIDGRDGDIVTKLGYAAYDKTFEIGLYGSYDINQVIAYFNSEGTVIFSNEQDKYYKYQILEQIDFERLIRYKTATVIMHAQPFKYLVGEDPIITEAASITGEGTSITLNNTVEVPFASFEVKGNTVQNGTPAPDNPIEIENVDSVEVKIINRNLFNVAEWVTKGNNPSYYSFNNGELSINALDSRSFSSFTEAEKIPLTNGTYYLSGIGTAGIRIYPNGDSTEVRTNIFTVTVGYIYLKLVSSSVITCQPQIENGEVQTTYEPYQEKTVSFPLAEGQKLYKKSYLADNGIHNARKHITANAGVSSITINDMKPNGEFVSSVGGTLSETTITFSSELTENADIEYELDEKEVIPYTTEQQEAYNQILNLSSYNKITHIYSIGNLPATLEVSVYGDNATIITNSGNIVAKPKFTIYGVGNIGVSLNSQQLFQIALGDEELITIDTANMEAYNPETGALKNRLVTGDYSNFILNPGTNTLSFTGIVSKVEVSNYSRWL